MHERIALLELLLVRNVTSWTILHGFVNQASHKRLLLIFAVLS